MGTDGSPNEKHKDLSRRLTSCPRLTVSRNCEVQIDKLVKSALYRINSKTSSDSALTPAVQRATAKQLLSIFNTSLNCASGSEALCSSINSKTFASLTYRITHQAPISPV